MAVTKEETEKAAREAVEELGLPYTVFSVDDVQGTGNVWSIWFSTDSEVMAFEENIPHGPYQEIKSATKKHLETERGLTASHGRAVVPRDSDKRQTLREFLRKEIRN